MSQPEDFLLSSYVYDLPESKIAQMPPKVRGTSRLMVLNRSGELGISHHSFRELPDLLPEGSLLVANNSRVLPARLRSVRSSGGKVEFLLLTPLPTVLSRAKPLDGGWFVSQAMGLTRAGGRIREGEEIFFGDDLKIRIVGFGDYGKKEVELFWRGDLAEDYKKEGSIPLPPYIRREAMESDGDRYQTVYSKEEKTGSVAAPTAGLHFTEEIRQELAAKGFGWEEVTLYVGYGTFSPVREEDIRKHNMHEELIEVPPSTVQAVDKAKREGRPVIAVGTTSVRALEGAARACGGKLGAWSGNTDIFLYPGKEFLVVDGLVTNFHLPGSSLVMLVAALCGRTRILEAYRQAVEADYRFFSYGDAMFVRP